MSKQTPNIKPVCSLFHSDVVGVDSLAELALDMRWPSRGRETFSLPTQAVAAGFDRFTPALIERYLGGYAEKKLGITRHDLLAMGRRDPNDSSENFNNSVLGELYADGINGSGPVRQKMNPDAIGQTAGAFGCTVCRTAVNAARPTTDYTARLIPRHDRIAVPLEDTRILWQR